MRRPASWPARARTAAVFVVARLSLLARAQDEGDGSVDPFADDPFTAPPTTPDPLRYVHPDYYHCATNSCMIFDEWLPVPDTFDNSSAVCQSALDAVLQGFAEEFPRMCTYARRNGRHTWESCKINYCETFEAALNRVLHLGGPQYYGAGKCDILLAFNRTLCESDYRDTESFCDCFCPTIELFQAPPDCEAEIWAFLLLGRRGQALAANYTMSYYCSQFLCRYFEEIGDPNPTYLPDLVGGVPETCHSIDLPFRYGQCRLLLSRQPYDPCPWDVPGERDDVLYCTDGSEHEVDLRHIDSWAICQRHDFRKRCPANYPVMCDQRNCVGEGAFSDHCCQTSVDQCRSGRKRQCSVALITDLPEWHGLLTPAAAIRRITTTTLDQMTLYGMMTFTTTPVVSLADELRDFMPIAFIGFGVIGIFTMGIILACLGKDHMTKAAKLVGAARIMSAFGSSERMVKIHPSGDVPYDKDREYLPPMRSAAEIQAEREDTEASLGLAAAHEEAIRYGQQSLVSVKDPSGPVETEIRLQDAIARVRERGLEGRGKNPYLIKQGEKWIQTLGVERELLQAVEGAKPFLSEVTKRMQALTTGQPFLTTSTGQAASAAMKNSVWVQVEVLQEALRMGKSDGAGDALVREASTLLAQFLARMPDLPADRCVLDPGGEGVRLLPTGVQRAVWLQTGDPYLYRPDIEQAEEIGDHGLPREELGQVSVDEARPICAEFASKRTCKAGRHCPWRHEVPKPGDSIRECIIFEDA